MPSIGCHCGVKRSSSWKDLKQCFLSITQRAQATTIETQPNNPIGISGFQELRSNGYCIDKTGFVREASANARQASLYLRPGRFCKTLALGMPANFLDITKANGNAHLFDVMELAQGKKNFAPSSNLNARFIESKFASGLGQMDAMLAEGKKRHFKREYAMDMKMQHAARHCGYAVAFFKKTCHVKLLENAVPGAPSPIVGAVMQ